MNAFVLVKCVVFVVAVVVAVVSPLNLTFLIMQLFNLAVWFFFVCFFFQQIVLWAGSFNSCQRFSFN